MTDSAGETTVDVPIKRGVAKVEMPAHGHARITAASGVVTGNELDLPVAANENQSDNAASVVGGEFSSRDIRACIFRHGVARTTRCRGFHSTPTISARARSRN